MDKNVNWINEKKIERTIKALENNNTYWTTIWV